MLLRAELFVAVAGASSYLYAKAFPSQELLYWVTGHVQSSWAAPGRSWSRKMFRGTFSGFCARPRYVADDDRYQVITGFTARHRPHNDQSDDSQLSSASSDLQAGRGRTPVEAPGGSVFRSASIFALVLISA